ncbi:pentapeptide repeat-containing protein [Nocardia sp. NPDC004722]
MSSATTPPRRPRIPSGVSAIARRFLARPAPPPPPPQPTPAPRRAGLPPRRVRPGTRRPARVTGLRRPKPSPGRAAVERARTIVTWGGWTKIAAVAATAGILASLLFNLNTANANDKQYDIARQKELTDRYAKAVEELANPNTSVQQGGLYLLSGLASDSREYRSSIYQVVAAFVRGQAKADSNCHYDPATRSRPEIRIEAALSILGHRDPDDTTMLDISYSCLAGAWLPGADLRGIRLDGVVLDGAVLEKAKFGGPTGPPIIGANFNNTELSGAAITNIQVVSSQFINASMGDVDLTGTGFGEVTMCGAGLSGEFKGFYAQSADIRDVYFGKMRDLASDAWRDPLYNEKTTWPPGLTIPPSKTPAVMPDLFPKECGGY